MLFKFLLKEPDKKNRKERYSLVFFAIPTNCNFFKILFTLFVSVPSILFYTILLHTTILYIIRYTRTKEKEEEGKM